MIVRSRESRNGPVIGIASDKGFCNIFIGKYMMNREIGFGRKVLQIFEEEGISYEHTPSGIDSITVIVREKLLDAPVEARIVSRIKNELNADDVIVERDRALVMLAGEGMMRTVGISCKATGAFARAGVNIEMINQGSSEVGMMFGIMEKDAEKAVKALYEEFFSK
jgi:aspartate kinase